LGLRTDLGQLLGGLLDALTPFDGPFAEYEISKAAVMGDDVVLATRGIQQHLPNVMA